MIGEIEIKNQTNKKFKNKQHKLCAECHEKVPITASACIKCGCNSFVYDKSISILKTFHIKHDRNSIDKKWQYMQVTDIGTIIINAKSKRELIDKVMSNDLPWDNAKAIKPRVESIKESNAEPEEKPRFKGYGNYYGNGRGADYLTWCKTNYRY